MRNEIVNKIGRIDCSYELLKILFPIKVGNFTRVLLRPFDLSEEMEAFEKRGLEADFCGVIRDIVIYVSDDLKEMRGLLLEYWKGYGFLFSACFLEAVILPGIKNVKDILDPANRNLWGYRGRDGEETYNLNEAIDSLYDLLI